MTNLVINVIGTPAPQGSHKGYVVNGRAVITQDNNKTKPWRHAVTDAATQAIEEASYAYPDPNGDVTYPIAGPVAVDVVFYMPRPGYHFGTGRNAGTLKATAPSYVDKKPDVDKLLRSTLDALTSSAVFRDDAQVARIAGVKRYADAATGARITITPLAPSPAVASTPTAGEASPTEGLF